MLASRRQKIGYKQDAILANKYVQVRERQESLECGQGNIDSDHPQS